MVMMHTSKHKRSDDVIVIFSLDVAQRHEYPENIGFEHMNFCDF